MIDDIPETGAVFTFGKSHFADNEPSHFFIKNDPIVAISCGDEHSAVICQNGRVFVFGANAWGQLGLGHKDEVIRPSCVKWLKPHRTLFVACGRAHTVFVTDTNAIYAVGCNDEGQLGTGDTEQQTVPQYVELDVDQPIRQVAAGSNHTAILTDEGRVFVCGSNSEGQLGLGEDTRSSLRFVELKFMEKIAFVECGYYHTVFITAKGAVFVTGENENQKLGIINTNNIIYVPQVLPLDVPIKSACCGANHTFLLSLDETKILAFGSNEQGQLGMPKNIEKVTEPTEINMDKMFDGFQLKLVACGAMHTAFVTDNGLLYTCGESRNNKLCLEEIDDANASEGDPNQYSPKRVTAMNGFVVDNVACGGCHTLLTATKGSNADFTNNDFSIINQENRQISITELPPLQKIPNMKTDDSPKSVNGSRSHETEDTNKNVNEDESSINSLEANVSGSHIVNINDLEPENTSPHDVTDNANANNSNLLKISSSIEKGMLDIAEKTDKMADSAIETIEHLKNTAKEEAIENIEEFTAKTSDKIEETSKSVNETVTTKVEAIEALVQKTVANVSPGTCCDKRKVLEVPNKSAEISHSPPPKSPLIQDLLQLPDISHMSPNISRHSDDGQKSEAGQSENETIPCGSDKSSPQAKTKTQAVMPILRNEDSIDSHEGTANPDADVVVNKNDEKGRFARMFQSIRDKENSCMSKGKVIEESVRT
ncbi:X-linked retinitis pigmentosa GTPase regulator-like isoform X2 [Leptidea sinapis]|uniref:X-linked retinitis pigmentosa GTPase regulator-like isoform X2 n=1 Tax=Leptidea sinapis TaxID=189913 RepID=UPI0021C406A8|nr:X-linked retinitis pigmentosa GTPase regulator-like isoform X2 [Leptidea sinapis]